MSEPVRVLPGPAGRGTPTIGLAGWSGLGGTAQAPPSDGDARLRLIDSLVGRVAPDGRLIDTCTSRVVESAVFLRLLEDVDRGGTHSGERQSLRRYLVATQAPDEGSTIVRDAALGNPDPARAARFRATFTHATGERKRVLIGTVFSLFDLVPKADLPTVDYRGQAVWTELVLCANNILGDHARGRSNPADQAFLVGRLAATVPGRPLHGNILTHLIALHALRTFQPKGPLLASGIATVSATRRPDGGVPFVSSQDTYLTAMAGIALAASGERRDVVARMADWIAATQLPDGGWGYCSETTQTDVDDTSRCVEFLRAVDAHRHRGTIAAAEDYLVGMAGADGGFPTYLAGHASEADMTAGAVIALSPARDRHARLLDAAVDYLVGQGRADGTFPVSWTLSESSVICHVLDALHAVPGADSDERVRRVTDTSTRRLRTTQNRDGGWGRHPGDPSDVLSTAQAVTALAHRGVTAPLDRAGRWLRAQQRADGSFPSIADQAAPRPHPYHYPSLADIHSLQALNGLRPPAPPDTGVRPGTPPDAQARPGAAGSDQDGAPTRLPEFYCPFPSIHLPRGELFDRRSIAWMRRYGLGADDEHRERLARSGVGHMVVRMAPLAGDELRQVASDFTMWITAFDDEYCDEGELHDRPGELAWAMERIHRCADVLEEPVDEGDRYGMSLRDLRVRLARWGSPAESDRFVNAMLGYFHSEATRSGFLARDEKPSLDAYCMTMLRSGGPLALAGLAAAINCSAAPPPHLLHDRSAAAVTEVAAMLSAWSISVVSRAKEEERSPDGFNLLDVVRTETGCTEAEAVERAMVLMDRTTTLFIRLRDRLRRRRPDLTDYLSGLEHYIRGSLDWALVTERYLYVDGRRMFEASGMRDTPRDHSTEPPPIPSIAWWWQHDRPHPTPPAPPPPQRVLRTSLSEAR
ncbi:terpene synthase family protein [Saccharothrix syringae]|uniref:Prenyltransferase alpha-alpha toroid domain-containing protein n=1 Tax=Saccharothrix syringae TaxID=103733 RepID=A0A5Q0GZZ2_SACSY|nr:prenyltransferase/squalene oxidase repeat-containing protein [Saccharothrix syringae]QFZ19561.1 hypothetical protein EKG83_20870 [Saccharothrix syringae]